MAKMSKKERESSTRFSKIKSWFKKKGFDVSNVKKSQKTYSSNERIRQDILKQLGIDAKISKIGKLFYDKIQFSSKLKEDIELKETNELVNKLQSIFGNSYNVSSNKQSDSSTQDKGINYETFRNLAGARDTTSSGYDIIYEFYNEIGEDINNAYDIRVTREMIENIEDEEIRKWALQAFWRIMWGDFNEGLWHRWERFF